MLATIIKKENGMEATFTRQWTHSVSSVWSMLTDNTKLKQWFSELKVEELQKGGLITFDMQDGTLEEMRITDFSNQNVLEFTWGEDMVRFELYEKEEGCLLLLKETITKLTPHTPRDLAGWHVCLEVVHSLLNKEETPIRKEVWEQYYLKYTELIKSIQ